MSKKKAAAKPVTAHALLERLRQRWPTPEWSVFTEVPNSTGGYSSRRADLVAMNMWPSRGLAVHGVEIKVRRSDWLRELKNPSKSGPIQQYCDFWWIVVGPGVVFEKDEIPSTWGLLELRGTRLMKVKEAPKLEATPPDRSFVAALLRCASTELEKVRRGVGRTKAYDEGFAAGQRALNQNEDNHQELAKSVKAFQEASGLIISEYNGKSLGEIVKVARLLKQQKFDAAWAATQSKAPLERALEGIRELEEAIGKC